MAVAIEAESDLSDAQPAALRDLRTVTLKHLRGQLTVIHQFWITLFARAKKTMHGVGFIAGCHVLALPGAGMVSAMVNPAQPRPFAVALDTQINHATRHANTALGTKMSTKSSALHGPFNVPGVDVDSWCSRIAVMLEHHPRIHVAHQVGEKVRGHAGGGQNRRIPSAEDAPGPICGFGSPGG